MRKLTASDRSALIRLAASLPKGSEERRAILSALSDRPPYKSPQGHLRRAVNMLMAGMPNGAVEEMTKALALIPRNDPLRKALEPYVVKFSRPGLNPSEVKDFENLVKGHAFNKEGF